METNGKITKKLRELGQKINGKTPSGETISDVIDGISEDYEGGSGKTVLEVSDITGLTTEQCESLNAGDVVVKLTSDQKHSYRVSYKEAGVGMCLTYVDATTSETVSYDYVTNAWVYNSTDITPLKDVVANPTLAGTEAELTGLKVGGNKYKVPNVQLYEHNINYCLLNPIHQDIMTCCFSVVTDNNTPFTYATLMAYLNSVLPLNDLDNTMPYLRKGIKATGFMTMTEEEEFYFANKIIKWSEQGGGAGHEGISCVVANGVKIEGEFAPMTTMFTLEESYTIEGQTFNTIEDVVIPVPNTSNNLG